VGRIIDTRLLSDQLGVPVVATVAVLNQVLDELTHALAILSTQTLSSPLQTVMELPALLAARWNLLGEKMWIRLKNFVTDGALAMLW